MRPLSEAGCNKTQTIMLIICRIPTFKEVPACLVKGNKVLINSVWLEIEIFKYLRKQNASDYAGTQIAEDNITMEDNNM